MCRHSEVQNREAEWEAKMKEKSEGRQSQKEGEGEGGKQERVGEQKAVPPGHGNPVRGSLQASVAPKWSWWEHKHGRIRNPV